MRKLSRSLLGVMALPIAVATAGHAARAACGPCRPKASQQGNPCAAKKKAVSPCSPCAPGSLKGPCGASDMPAPKAADFTRPKRSKRFTGDHDVLVAMGKKLYGDTRLSSNELSCDSCHSDFNNYGETFKKPYPHTVKMPKDVSGVGKITAEQMVQFCLIRPMMGKPLAWDSKELAALAAYVEEQREHFAKR